MERRRVIKTLGAAALAQLSSGELVALGRAFHRRIQQSDELVSIDGDRHIFKSLDSEENETVTVVSELILPATDTAGAKAARVNEFIDLMLSEWFTPEERSRFHRGLAELDERARSQHGARFVDCEVSVQTTLLEELEQEGLEHEERLERERERSRTPVAATTSPADRPFFLVMKWLTLYGYYTSEVGMEEELQHVVFPASYDGCVPIRRSRVE